MLAFLESTPKGTNCRAGKGYPAVAYYASALEEPFTNRRVGNRNLTVAQTQSKHHQ